MQTRVNQTITTDSYIQALSALLLIGIAKDKAEEILSISTAVRVKNIPAIIARCQDPIIGFGMELIRQRHNDVYSQFVYMVEHNNPESVDTVSFAQDLRNIKEKAKEIVQDIVPVNEFVIGLMNKNVLAKIEKFKQSEDKAFNKYYLSEMIKSHLLLPEDEDEEAILHTNLSSRIFTKKNYLHSSLFLNGNFTHATLKSSLGMGPIKPVCVTQLALVPEVNADVRNNIMTLRIFAWEPSLLSCLLIGVALGGGMRYLCKAAKNVSQFFTQNKTSPVRSAEQELDLNTRASKHV